jgi:hypothetical protein
MISPQWYQPDQRENTEPNLEMTRHHSLTVTCRHPHNTPRHPNHLSPLPQGIWLGPAVRPSSTIGHPPLFETPAKPSLSASPPQSPTPPSHSNPRASTCPSSWGVKYPRPSHKWHPSCWLERIPMRMDGVITYENRPESDADRSTPHPMTWQGATRCHHSCPPPQVPPDSSNSTPPEWDYLPHYNPLLFPQTTRPPPTPPSTPCAN